MAGECTLVLWYYRESKLSGRDSIFEKRATTRDHSYEQEIAVAAHPDGDAEGSLSYYSGYDANKYDYGFVFNVNINAWNQVAIKMSSGKTSVARQGWYSANGASFTEDYTSRTSTAIHPAGNIVVGDGYNGRMESGYIAEVMVYNRTLTDVEILYNYCEKRQIWSLTCCNAQFLFLLWLKIGRKCCN